MLPLNANKEEREKGSDVGCGIRIQREAEEGSTNLLDVILPFSHLEHTILILRRSIEN